MNAVQLGKGKSLSIDPAEDGSDRVFIPFHGDGRSSFAYLTLEAIAAVQHRLDTAADELAVRRERSVHAVS